MKNRNYEGKIENKKLTFHFNFYVILLTKSSVLIIMYDLYYTIIQLPTLLQQILCGNCKTSNSLQKN